MLTNVQQGTKDKKGRKKKRARIVKTGDENYI